MKKITLKIILDLIIIILLLSIYDKNIISIGFHEIVGLIVFFLVIMHIILNKKWIYKVSKNLLNYKINKKALIKYIISISLFICLISIVISGVMISKFLFSFNIRGFWIPFHKSLCAIALILIGIHFGLNWSFLVKKIKKFTKIPDKIGKPLGVILIVIIFLTGVYSINTTNYIDWLESPFDYDDTKQEKFNQKNQLGRFSNYENDVNYNHGERNSINQYRNSSNNNLINLDRVTIENIFPLENKNYLNLIILMIQFASIVFVFALITRIIELIFKE